jgi:hypothetical protein
VIRKSDAKRAIDSIKQFTSGKNLADYIADQVLRSAAERQMTTSLDRLHPRGWQIRAAATLDQPKLQSIPNRLLTFLDAWSTLSDASCLSHLYLQSCELWTRLK